MNRFLLFALLVFAAISGCSAFGPSAADVRFETTESSYAPGDDVIVRLTNTSDEGVGYNLCYTTVEGEGPWGPVEVTDRTVACVAVQYGLEPGDDAERVVALPTNVPVGAYRLVTDVELSDGRRVTVKAPFEVR